MTLLPGDLPMVNYMVKQEEIYWALGSLEIQGDFASYFNDLSFILLQNLPSEPYI